MSVTSGNRAFPDFQKLNALHRVDDFDCGEEELNDFIRHRAIHNQRSDSSQTYVVCQHEQQVVGYYSLVAASTRYVDAPSRIAKGQARYPVPVILLARIAVDRSEQNKGLGTTLFKDILQRVRQVADIVGVRALLVHAKNDEVLTWYERFQFEASPENPHHLFLLMKDIRALLRDQS